MLTQFYYQGKFCVDAKWPDEYYQCCTTFGACQLQGFSWWKIYAVAADESADCFPLNFGSWYWKSLCKNKPQNEPLFFTPFQQQLSIFLSHCCTKGITKYTPLPLIADTKLQRLRKKERQNSNAGIMVSLTNHNQLASIAWTCSKKSAEQRVNLNS